jgi:tetratricopeptide (TPR) repeat protein
MTDHCFISYSTIDALEFARKLANELEGGEDKYIDAWFDKRDLKAGIDWRPQLSEAIRECKVLLFVMTKDSVEPQSVTNEEWAFALKYKKPIIPLRLHKETDLPFGLGRRQWIDFTGEFEHGLAQLRKRLADLDSPKGQLQLMRDRLADAERDLRRATPEDEVRIQAEIEQLKNDIKYQDVIVRDPDYAEKRTRKNISAGLQVERQPLEVKPEAPTTKFINPIPLMAPPYFQGRLPELSQIADFLKNDHQRISTIIGRAGGGKTALSCYLLKSLEIGKLPENLGEFKVGGIVYLSEIGSHKVSFANIYSGLTQLLPEETANKLDALYRQPKISVSEKTRQLLEAFQQEKVVVLLDNFELFVDTETENLIDVELKEALEALLRAPQHPIKIVITTRVPAKDLALIEPSRHNNLHLEEGLKSPYAENILRAMDEDGRAGFKDASNEQLGRARELTLGYPRALESLYAIISVDRYTNIDELLAVELPETVVENLVGEAFSRLDITAQKVMQALAVYNRPVPPAAIDYLLQQHIPGIISSPILARLVSMHFARREAGRFYLHPVDREYAFGRIPEGGSGKHVGKGARSRIWDQYALILRAADYYTEARKPESEWKKLEDFFAPLAEFDLRIIAKDYDGAMKVLKKIGFDYLMMWGHYSIVVDLAERLKDFIQDIELRVSNLNLLGSGYSNIGRSIDAIDTYHKGLELVQKMRNTPWEITFLTNLSSDYASIGKIEKSIEFNERGLNLSRENHLRYHEASCLITLGTSSYEFEGGSKAIEYIEQGIEILHEIKTDTQIREQNALSNLANIYALEGDFTKAIEVSRQSLAMALTIGKAKSYEYAVLAQAYMFNGNLLEARINIDLAEKYNDALIHGHNISLLFGVILLKQGELDLAQEAFSRTIARSNAILLKTAEYFDALDAKGLAMCGLELILNTGNLSDAKQVFIAARNILSNFSAHKRRLLYFDEIAKADNNRILDEVRPLLAGQK